jgi:hypothetical protein
MVPWLVERYRRFVHAAARQKPTVNPHRQHLLSGLATHFVDLGADYYDHRTGPELKSRNHIRHLEALPTRSPSNHLLTPDPRHRQHHHAKPVVDFS